MVHLHVDSGTLVPMPPVRSGGLDPDVRIEYPRWSPDGRSVIFDRAAPRGGADLWTLEGF